MQCATCGNANLPEARFCARCGSALAELAAAASTPATPTPPPLLFPPSVQAVPAGVVYADFAVRFGAWFIDLLIIVAINTALGFWGRSTGITGSGSGPDAMVGLLFLASPWLYYWLFTGLRGQTPGKMLVGIMVVNERGNRPGLGRAALRELLGKPISFLALFIGILWIAWDDFKQGWHDKLATTYVVRRSRRQ